MLFKKQITVIALLLSLLIAGCATPLTTAQKQELNDYQHRGLAVEEKNPGLAAGLGLLPGGGSFYTHNYGTGVVNLLLWPLSILWDPVSGLQGAESINYYATMNHVDNKRQNAMEELEDEYELDNITREQYVRQRREIRQRY